MKGVQETTGAGTEGDGRRLEDELQRWLGASVITMEQAEEIRRVEAEHAHAIPPPSRIPLIAQALGFLGGALAMIAGIVATSRFWDEFSTATRLIVVAVVAALFVGAGRVVRREGEPALAHLGSFLWLLAVGSAAFWAGIFAIDVLDWEGADVASVVGIVASAVAAGLWAWRPAPLQHAATLVAVAVAVGGITGQVEHIGGRFIGIALWALGVVWMALAWKGVVRPAPLGYAAGGALTIVAGRILGDEGGWTDTITILTALALLAASVPTRSMVLLWVGVAAVFLSVPTAIAAHFGDTLGAPVVLFLAGMSLIGVAVVVSRLVREVRAAPPLPARFSPTTISGALFGVVAVVVALTIGFTQIKSVPVFPSLRQTPDSAIPGSIAFMRSDRDRACVHVVAASGVGADRPLLCERDLEQGPPLTWNDAGHVVAHQYREAGSQFVEIDPTTGTVVARGPFDEQLDKTKFMDPGRRSSDGASISTEGSAPGRPRLTLHPPTGASRTAFTTEGPSDYEFRDVMWSPDGHYVAVLDSEHRLLIVDADSPSPTARVLTTNATSPAWSTWSASR